MGKIVTASFMYNGNLKTGEVAGIEAWGEEESCKRHGSEGHKEGDC